LIDKVINVFSSALNLPLRTNRNSIDRSTTHPNLRPDFCCWAKNVLVLKGEEKADVSNWVLAVAELSDKMSHMSRILFGGVPFIFAYAAAGTDLAFIVIRRGQPAVQVSETFNITTTSNRMKVFRTLVNIIRVLRRLVPLLPDSCFPIYETIKRPNGVELYIGDNFIRKTVPGVTALTERGLFYDSSLRRLYSDVIPVGFQYSTFSPNRNVRISDDKFHVDLHPIGWPKVIRKERDARNALKSVLETLALLHRNGLVHRDVRSDNIILCEHGWILIDFEFCAPLNSPIVEQLPYWPEWCSPGSTFTTADDIWMTGKMLLKHIQSIFVTMEFRRLIHSMLTLPAELCPNAAEALKALQELPELVEDA
jgi:hypothetical protein